MHVSSLAVFHLWWAAAWILPLSSAFVPVNHSTGRSKLARFQLDAMQVTIRIVGKKSGGEKWIDEACSMYQTRLRPANIDVETTFLKSDDALVKAVEGDYSKGNAVVLLDPKGKPCTSEKLAVDVYKWLEAGGSRLVFVIGGAEGLPEELRSGSGGRRPTLVSLSELTFTHQFARLVLIEQVYRASEIRKGSGYHK